MNRATADTRGRFLLDLKKLLTLHRDFGIEAYPRSPGVEHFLKASTPLPVRECRVSSDIVPLSRTSLTVQKTNPLPITRSVQTLADIQTELGDCRRCPLHETRGQLVFGGGAPKATLFIVGDFPNQADEAAGLPFSGEAGELLSKMLKAIGLSFADVYLSTIVKCHVPSTETPAPDQVKTCLSFLLRQIDAVAPKVICAMGSLAAQTLLCSKTPLIRLRGNFHDCHGTPLMPTFHPAFLLKNQALKRATWIDLQLIQAKLGLV